MKEVKSTVDKRVESFITIGYHETEIKKLNSKIDNISKLTYIGVGIWLLLQVVLIIYFKSRT